MKLDKKHLTNIFKSNNPKWIGNKKAKEMGEHNIALAKKKGKPNFGVGLGWMETDKSLMPNTRGSGDDPIALTLSLSIPLWRGKVKSQINSEKHKYKSVKEMGESILDNFESDLEIVLFRINDSKRKNELYLNDLLPKVKDAYKSTMTAYEAGKVSFQNLLDAERLVLRISLDYEISKTNHLKSYSNLKKLVGEIR
jgi:outer membrane protein TolC